MDRELQCECGFVARAESEDGLVAEIRRHARDAHGMTLTNDEAVLLAFRSELTALPATPRDPDRKGGSE